MTTYLGGLRAHLQTVCDRTMEKAFGEKLSADVRSTADARFGDYQVNGVLPLAKTRKANPRQLAAEFGPLDVPAAFPHLPAKKQRAQN